MTDPQYAIDCDVVVVGAGFGGLYALHKFRELGYSVIGFEAAPDAGGTWYWNRYPGARCDVPSVYYSYTWSPELRREWRWSEKYSTQPEILRYLQYVAERFNLRPLIRFDTRVERASYDERARAWAIETDDGSVVRATFCIMATGCLSVPNTPDIEGLAQFKGSVFHTGRWPQAPVDFTGQRVGVIGTGSSGVQAIPEIARDAAHVAVFQRTPCFSIPARNSPISDDEYEALEATLDGYLEALDRPEFGRVSIDAFDATIPSLDEQRARYEQMWQQGGGFFLYAYPNLLTNGPVNETACEFVRTKIRATVDDPVTAAALCPTDYPLGVKRICVDTNYYETYNRANVELVNLRENRLTKVTADGVQTEHRLFPLDSIVLATGFDAMTGALMAMDISGRNGVSLNETWTGGPRAYLGLMVAGFPNLFMLTGPGSPSVIGNVVSHCEHHVDWVADCVEYMRCNGFATAEADPAAQDQWVAHVAEVADRTLFPKAKSWYLGANIPGKPRVFMPYVGNGYRYRCAEIAADGYRGIKLSKETEL
jgi:cyclohexanone monooxygenase